jgi:2-polyprenyl-6-methoxyphenol hydroxylase-like FAD-dependent oxidoreductase
MFCDSFKILETGSGDSMTPAEKGYSKERSCRRSARVAIAGGGIGGMALALALHDAGFRDVDVYESASSVKELGVGINVLPHATRELTELGLLDELDAVAIPTAELAYYSKRGQRIWSEPRGINAGYRWPQFSIHRGQLLGVLYRSAQTPWPRTRALRPSSVALRPG